MCTSFRTKIGYGPTHVGPETGYGATNSLGNVRYKDRVSPYALATECAVRRSGMVLRNVRYRDRVRCYAPL
eukprot:3729758-Rhodomonas_salina.1